MKTRLIAALLLLTSAPGAALAQTSPATVTQDAVTVTGSQISAGLALMSHTVQMQQQARSAMLNALTPAHRELLAQTVGQLAIAPDGNLDAAAARLDSTLSPAELQAITRIAAAQRAQLLTAAGQLQTTLTPDQLRQARDQTSAAMRAVSNSALAPGIIKMMQAESDPGHILLQAAVSVLQPFGAFLKAQGR